MIYRQIFVSQRYEFALSLIDGKKEFEGESLVNKGKIRRKSGCHNMKNFISFLVLMSVYIATIKLLRLCRSIIKKCLDS